MSIDTRNIESFRGDHDQYLRAEQMVSRLEILKNAQANYALALRFNQTPKIAKGIVNMDNHFWPKNFLNVPVQEPVEVSQAALHAANTVMNPDQLGLRNDTPPAPKTEWDHAMVKLAASVKQGDVVVALNKDDALKTVYKVHEDAEASKYLDDQATAGV